jgi:hypothetical protein
MIDPILEKLREMTRERFSKPIDILLLCCNCKNINMRDESANELCKCECHNDLPGENL